MTDFTDHLKPAYDGTATLQAERDGSRIDVPELAQHLLGRHGFLQRQEKVLRVLRREKLFDKTQQLNLSRPERYQLSLARAKLIQRLIKREDWDHEDYRMAEYLNDEMSPYFLHMSMFGESPDDQSRDVMHILCDGGAEADMHPIAQSQQYASKLPRSSSDTGCLRFSTTTSLDAMRRPSWAMEAMFGGWRLQPNGTQPRRNLKYIVQPSRLASGGMGPWGGPPRMRCVFAPCLCNIPEL